jgi:diacylglycerol kinase (ATP)
MSACVILNPRAGTAGETDAIKRQIERLGEVSFRITDTPGDAQRLAREAAEDGCDLVVAAGGDGTINEVVNGLSEHFGDVRLGIIPMGTGNDFARSVDVPTDVQAAVNILLADQRRAIDVVRVTSDAQRYFINVSAGGFSGLVDERLTEEMKRSWGPLAYLRSAAEALPDLTDYHTRIAFDGEELHEIATYNIVIANARYVAGGIPIAPQAEIDDGLVDVMIVPRASMPQLAMLVPQILLGQHTDNDLLIFRRARKVEVESQPRMWFNADGELVGNEPSTFEVLPRALNVIVGSEGLEARR